MPSDRDAADRQTAYAALRSAVDAAAIREGGPGDAIDGAVPAAVVSPRSLDGLGAALSAANGAGLAVTPRGGGTMLGLGNPVKRLDAVVDMGAFSGVVEHNAADLTVVAQAGITLAALRERLAMQGQFLALDAPLPHRATIGGILASGAAGPLRWRYGSARDLVIGMQVMQPDGRLTRSGGRVVKNVSGYDMARLHAGAIGSLGIITEVAFKLTPMPRGETTFVGRFASAEQCLSAALAVYDSDVMPLALTAYDSGARARLGADASSERAYSLAIRLGGRPRALKRMEGSTLFRCLTSGGNVDRLDGAGAAALWEGLADLGWGEQAGGAAAMSVRIATLPTKVLDVMAALSMTGAAAAVTAQPGYGTVNAHWGCGDEARLGEALSAARDVARAVGGTLTVERAPLSLRAAADVWGYDGDSLDIMRRLKAQYDPNGVLNPNRYAGGI